MFCNYDVAGAPTNHTEESLCYRIEDRHRAMLFYSGDSGYNDNLISLAKGVDAAILEASMTEATRVADHLTPALAGKIGRIAGVKQLILTHLYPHVYQTDILREVANAFSGKVVLAGDGMELTI